jgi:outer-membrane receptor for ferric coprogen and ferric-rhodotorulic acid
MSFSAKHCCLAIAISLSLGALPALAQQTTTPYALNLPEQPLRDSLLALGKATHVNIVFDPAVVAGRRAPVLRGQYAPGEALERLLAGSGLSAQQTPGGSYTVEPPQAQGSSPSGTRPANSSRIAGDASNTNTLDTVVVTAKVEGFSATRMPTPLKEIPQSVSVITQDTLREQNANDLSKAFNWATGITVTQNGSVSDQYLARGFAIDLMHVDGGGPLLGNGMGGMMRRQDLSEYERVELLRGADALFGGSGLPGGSINLVRKRPLPENAASVSASAGSWDNYRVEADLSGKLVTDGRLRGRLVAVNESQHYFYDIAKRRMSKVYAVTEYDLLPHTRLTLGGSFEHTPDFVQFPDGLPRYANGADPHLPRSTALAFPWAKNTSTAQEGFAQLEQSFGERWKLKAGATHTRQEQDGVVPSFRSSINPVTHLVALPSAIDPRIRVRQTAFDLTLTGGFDWHGHAQELVFGVDYSRMAGNPNLTYLQVSGPPLDPFNFDPMRYSAASSPFSLRMGGSLEAWERGLYAAFKLRPADRWAVTVGARSSSQTEESTQTFQLGPTPLPSRSSKQSANGVITPYAGVVYEIGPQYSLYASYADVFSIPYPTLTAAGTVLGPQRGTNVEVGVKSGWNAGRLSGSLALFDIKLDNVAVYDPNTPRTATQNCCYVPGTKRSKGLEAELSGLLAPGWQLGAGYTFNINHTTDGSTLSTQTPKHLLKLWTSYRLPGPAAAWSIGGGLTAQTGNYYRATACTAFNLLGRCIGGHVPYRAEQGFYSVATLRVGYRLNEAWDVALNVDNLFDRRYYSTIGGSTAGNWYGMPRNWMLTLRGEF